MARYIPPPREDFIDPRTGKIAVSWFRYLLKEAGNVDDVQLQSALNAVYGVAAAAQAEQRADEVALLASLPVQSQDFAPQIDEAKLMAMRTSPQDWSRDIEEARLTAMRTPSQDFAPDIEAVRLASTPKAEHGTSAAKIAGRVLVGL